MSEMGHLAEATVKIVPDASDFRASLSRQIAQALRELADHLEQDIEEEND